MTPFKEGITTFKKGTTTFKEGITTFKRKEKFRSLINWD
jgi:hypothetical protein